MYIYTYSQRSTDARTCTQKIRRIFTLRTVSAQSHSPSRYLRQRDMSVESRAAAAVFHHQCSALPWAAFWLVAASSLSLQLSAVFLFQRINCPFFLHQNFTFSPKRRKNIVMLNPHTSSTSLLLYFFLIFRLLFFFLYCMSQRWSVNSRRLHVVVRLHVFTVFTSRAFWDRSAFVSSLWWSF